MKKGPIILLTAISLCFSRSAFAESIILKSGKKLEGKIIKKTDKYIQIDSPGVPLTYFFNEIESIDGQEAVLPTPNSQTDGIKLGKNIGQDKLLLIESISLGEDVLKYSKELASKLSQDTVEGKKLSKLHTHMLLLERIIRQFSLVLAIKIKHHEQGQFNPDSDKLIRDAIRNDINNNIEPVLAFYQSIRNSNKDESLIKDIDSCYNYYLKAKGLLEKESAQ